MRSTEQCKVGERLQQARVRLGLSLREISARTKIRTAFLDAIEREDFERLPKGLLARGFLRAYAREVGLDPESVVRQFQEAFEPEAIRPDPASPASAEGSEQTLRNDGLRPGRWQLAGAVVVVLLGAVLVFFFRGSELHEPVPPDTAAEIGAGIESETDIGQAAEYGQDQLRGDSAVPAVNASESDSLTVVISPAALVWVEAIADGARVLFQLIHPGERHVIDVREELLVRVGDAGAFQYSINGVRGRQLGASGSVRDIRITRQNYTSFHDR